LLGRVDLSVIPEEVMKDQHALASINTLLRIKSADITLMGDIGTF
jgi:hypothetical protein